MASSVDLFKTLLRRRAEAAGVATRLIADIRLITAHEDEDVSAWRD